MATGFKPYISSISEANDTVISVNFYVRDYSVTLLFYNTEKLLLALLICTIRMKSKKKNKQS
jgi:hypothetical protein